MGKVARVVLQGVHRRLSSGLPLFFVFFTTMSGLPAIAADDPVACRSPIARVVSIQGTIQVSRSGSPAAWAIVSRLDTTLCPGDRLRTSAQSRAALFVQPETLVRIDQSTTIVIGANPDEPTFEFTQNDIVPVSVGDHACGAGYFVTRFPKKFKVRTPHFDAAVEGTEFLVAMRCELTDLSVIEGKVLASSNGAIAFPSQSVVGGQTLTVGGDTPPAIKVLIKPADAVQWTLYYPPLTPAGTAVPEDCRTVPVDHRASCLIAQAEQFLRAGQADEAQAHIADALSGAPDSSDAKALSSIISLVKNDKMEALRLAKESVDANASSAPAWLAMSYAQQADFKLEAALTSAQKSAELETSALSLARVAELQLSLGWTREAEKTAKKAVEVNPEESRAHMILGFVHLAQIETKAAKEDFGRAIELDSTEPLTRLGRGLAIIREGKLVEGREQIEIAVALDPTNSLIRSYVGKAYYEENTKARDELAVTQFGLAEELDPKDPTPWFYAALVSQSQSRFIPALEDFQKAISLNDNRAPYRSQFLLESDSAARLASLARTYLNTGFDRLAINEAANSQAIDPGNYTTHKFLSEIYDASPRSVVSRESELLQSQVRQPLGISPTSPFRSQSNPLTSVLPATNLPSSVGPGRLAFSEFNPLYTRNGLALFLDGLIGEQDTESYQAVVSGLLEKMSFSASAGHFSTDGFQDNRDFTQNASNIFLQLQPTDQFGIQGEFLESRITRGDAFTPFDPLNATNLRIGESSNSYRVSGRYDLSPRSDVVVSAMRQHFGANLDFVDFDQSTRFEGHASTGEVQYLFSGNDISLLMGANETEGEITQPDISFETRSSFNNQYLYTFIHPSPIPAKVEIGLSHDYYKSGDFIRDLVSPKLGLILNPTGTTTVRASVARSLKRPFLGERTLEPSNLAGFNQFYDDPDGAVAWQFGIAIDQELPAAIHVGAETFRRNLEVPIVDGLANWSEKRQRLYIYIPISSDRGSRENKDISVAITAGLEREEIRRPDLLTGTEGIRFLNTDFVPLGLTIVPAPNLSIQLKSTYVHQCGDLQVFSGADIFETSSRFWVSDASMTYNLPRRRGKIGIGVSNLEDKHFSFVNSDPAMARFALGRIAFARLTLQFQ